MSYYVIRVDNTVTQSNYMTSNDGRVIYANAAVQNYIYDSGSNQPMVFMGQAEALKVLDSLGLRNASSVELKPWTRETIPGAYFSKSFQRSWVFTSAFNPLTFNAIMWLDASNVSSIVKDGSNRVSQWNNLGSIGGSFVQPTALKQPTWSNSDLGYAGIRYNAASVQEVTRSNAYSPTALDIYIVFRANNYPTVDGLKSGLWQMGNPSPLTLATHIPWTDGKWYDAAGSTTRQNWISDLNTTGSNIVYQVTSTATEWTGYLNYTQKTTTGTNTVSLPSILSIGNSYGNYAFDGVIREMIVFPAKLSTTDRNTLRAYLTAKWGTV